MTCARKNKLVIISLFSFLLFVPKDNLENVKAQVGPGCFDLYVCGSYVLRYARALPLPCYGMGRGTLIISKKVVGTIEYGLSLVLCYLIIDETQTDTNRGARHGQGMARWESIGNSFMVLNILGIRWQQVSCFADGARFGR